MTLAFAGTWPSSVLDRSRQAAAEAAAFEGSQADLGAEGASAH